MQTRESIDRHRDQSDLKRRAVKGRLFDTIHDLAAAEDSLDGLVEAQVSKKHDSLVFNSEFSYQRPNSYHRIQAVHDGEIVFEASLRSPTHAEREANIEIQIYDIGSWELQMANIYQSVFPDAPANKLPHPSYIAMLLEEDEWNSLGENAPEKGSLHNRKFMKTGARRRVGRETMTDMLRRKAAQMREAAVTLVDGVIEDYKSSKVDQDEE